MNSQLLQFRGRDAKTALRACAVRTVVAEGLSPERQEQIDAILELSQQMLDLAQGREWEVLTAIEATRQQKLHQFFSIPAAPEDIAQIAKFIQQVLAMDRQIVEWGEAYRRELMDGLDDLGRARRASVAYGEHKG